jgi:nucleoside-diphosphate-sugar epimerase
VLEAAGGFGIDRVCLPSSINVLGCIYQEEPLEVSFLPVDEDHPVTPRDPYAVGKHAMEVTADGFGRANGAPRSIVSLRYPWVASSTQLREVFAGADRSIESGSLADPPGNRDELFSYVHVDDAARAARLAVEHDVAGHVALWITAEDTTSTAPTRALIDRYYPSAEVRNAPEGHDGLVDTSLAASTIDWQPQHSWRSLERSDGESVPPY